MKYSEVPEVISTEDAVYLRTLSRKERLAKYDDNCLSVEKVVFTEEMSDTLIKATSPLLPLEPDR